MLTDVKHSESYGSLVGRSVWFVLVNWCQAVDMWAVDSRAFQDTMSLCYLTVVRGELTDDVQL